MDEPPFGKAMLRERPPRRSNLEMIAESYTHPMQQDYMIASAAGIVAGAATLYATGVDGPAQATILSSAVLHATFFATQWALTHLRAHDDLKDSLYDALTQNMTNAPGVVAYNLIVLLGQGALTALSGSPIASFVALNAIGTLATRPSHHFTHQKYEAWRAERNAWNADEDAT